MTRMDKWVVWFSVQLLSELLQLQLVVISTYTVYRCWYTFHDFFAIGLGLERYQYRYTHGRQSSYMLKFSGEVTAT
jgi:hypothetical protein